MHSKALNFLVWWSYLPKAIFTKPNASSALSKSLGLVMKRSAAWLAHGTGRERAQRLQLTTHKPSSHTKKKY